MNPNLILLAIASATELIKFVQAAREAAKQSTEWTPEMEAQFDAMMELGFDSPHWKIDDQTKG